MRKEARVPGTEWNIVPCAWMHNWRKNSPLDETIDTNAGKNGGGKGSNLPIIDNTDLIDT
jgi:hypothetical protein